MDIAHEAGIDCFDVANGYGREAGETETAIGWVLPCSVRAASRRQKLKVRSI